MLSKTLSTVKTDANEKKSYDHKNLKFLMVFCDRNFFHYHQSYPHSDAQITVYSIEK